MLVNLQKIAMIKRKMERKKERHGRVGVEGNPFLLSTGNASKHAWNTRTDRRLLHARCSRDGSLSQNTQIQVKAREIIGSRWIAQK